MKTKKSDSEIVETVMSMLNLDSKDKIVFTLKSLLHYINETSK